MRCEICGCLLPDEQKWSHLATAHPYGFAATVETVRHAIDSAPGWLAEAKRDEAKLLRLAAALPKRVEESKRILREAKHVYGEACEMAVRVVSQASADRGLRETLRVQMDNVEGHIQGRFKEKAPSLVGQERSLIPWDPYQAERRRRNSNA